MDEKIKTITNIQACISRTCVCCKRLDKLYMCVVDNITTHKEKKKNYT